MGWKGNGGAFEVLPLVIQYEGGKPELFEIPDKYIMRVKITHPRYCINIYHFEGRKFTSCIINVSASWKYPPFGNFYILSLKFDEPIYVYESYILINSI